MSISYRKLLNFSQIINQRQAVINASGKKTKEELKFLYAIKRVSPQFTKIQEDIQDKLADLDIDFASTEKKGNDEVLIVDDKGNYMYTKEKRKAWKDARNELFDNETIDITPYFTTGIPKDLSDYELEVYSGIIVDPEDVKRLMNEREAELEKLETEVEQSEE